VLICFRAPGDVVARLSGFNGADLPRKAFVFRSPAKLPSLGSQRDLHPKKSKLSRLQPEMAKATWSKLNAPLMLDVRKLREKSSVLEQRSRPAEAVRVQIFD